jgi:Carboxypeptidase regulatory-like domain
MFGGKNSRAVLFSACLLALTQVCFAQSGSSTILGTLTDQVDAVVTQGTITVTELATGATQTVTPNETGLFRVLNLLPGRYSLRAEVQGFKALDISEIVLASSETRDLGKLRMQLGTVTEEVSVSAAATPVQTASAALSSTRTSCRMSL